MSTLKQSIARIPLIGDVARKIYYKVNPFPGSQSYWDQRYKSGLTSGEGSYGKLARFKADILNEAVREHTIKSVIEYGCGDGNQLKLAQYPQYLGFDVSPAALCLCECQFIDDTTKKFHLMSDYAGETADLTLSLDVIYHLVEDEIYAPYMHRLFQSATRFVIIYSSNDLQNTDATHVRHRKFTDWIDANTTKWTLLNHIPNIFPHQKDNKKGSFADFYIYHRSDQ